MAKQKKQRILTKFTEDQLVEYFNEHVLYELLMLRYSHGRLRTTTEVLWNAMFSAFNVSARNLYDFLNNNGSNNEVKRHEYSDYAKTFKLSAISPITGTLQLLNEQVFHMGRKRPADRDGKVTLKRVNVVFDWVDGNVCGLVASFEPDFKEKIQVHRANPNYSDGMLRVTDAETKKLETSSHPFELKSVSQGVLSAQNYTSHIQGVFLVPKEDKSS